MLSKLKTISIDYNSSKDIINLYYNGSFPFSTYINLLLNESRYGYNIYHKPIFDFSPDFNQSLILIIDDIKDLMKRKEYLLARNTSDAIFNACTIYWQRLMSNGQHIVAKEFWKKIIDTIIGLENKKVKIHKGTPYFFLAHTCLLLDDIENTFIYLSKAIYEDEKSCKLFGQNYQMAPGYKTVSLSAEKNNFMYPDVMEVRNYLENHLKRYNRKLRKNLAFKTIENKFFNNAQYVDPMIFLNFIIHVLRIQEESINKIDNDFSKIRLLNLIFCLCLVVDKTLWIRFSGVERYISGNVQILGKTKGWGSKRYIYNVYRVEVNNLIESKKVGDFNKIINKLLDYKLTYRGSIVRKEIQTLLLLWGLRNQGAHRLEKQNILIKRYKDIIEIIMYSFFMSVY